MTLSLYATIWELATILDDSKYLLGITAPGILAIYTIINTGDALGIASSFCIILMGICSLLDMLSLLYIIITKKKKEEPKAEPDLHIEREEEKKQK